MLLKFHESDEECTPFTDLLKDVRSGANLHLASEYSYHNSHYQGFTNFSRKVLFHGKANCLKCTMLLILH